MSHPRRWPVAYPLRAFVLVLAAGLSGCAVNATMAERLDLIDEQIEKQARAATQTSVSIDKVQNTATAARASLESATDDKIREMAEALRVDAGTAVASAASHAARERLSLSAAAAAEDLRLSGDTEALRRGQAAQHERGNVLRGEIRYVRDRLADTSHAATQLDAIVETQRADDVAAIASRQHFNERLDAQVDRAWVENELAASERKAEAIAAQKVEDAKTPKRDNLETGGLAVLLATVLGIILRRNKGSDE